MARVLFTVCGVGLGHASRASIIIRELKKKHEIKILTYGDAVEFLEREFDNVEEVDWFKIHFKKGRISKSKTFAFNLPYLPSVSAKNYSKIKKSIDEFKPDVIVSDFDVFGIYASKIFNIPSILISNLHAEKFFQPELNLDEKLEQKLTDDMLLSAFPKPTHCVVTSIIKPTESHENTHFFYSIIDSKIIKAKPVEGTKFLCYFGSEYLEKIIPLLKLFPEKQFVFYGKNSDEKDENIEFRKFSRENWIKDISECNALLCHGGLLTISEAVFLNKPIYVFATKHWFERLFNGSTVQTMGFGLLERKPTKEGLNEFFSRLSEFKKNLKEKKIKVENKELIETINSLIEKETSKK
ncbi:MAG: hypothetical protein JW703_03310 [Candidatus Diapherotrites archaeon]|nr:hypothetical protein [Candidatus Diapherotrites archaeon]